MLFSAPLEVARTNAWTFAPRWTSASVRCEPMKPSAPVTSTVRPPKCSAYSRSRSASAASLQTVSWSVLGIRLGRPMEGSVSPRTTVARSGLQTALSLATVTGLAAVVGVIIAREFGRGAVTDGFFAAYGLFIVIVLVATGLRPVVLPWLARAQEGGRLGVEVEAWAMVLAALGIPALVLGLLAADWTAELLTGGLPDAARRAAATVLPWMLPAAVCQLYAALAASALAALDDYATAAVAYAAGSVSGLALILWRVGEDGVAAVAWGMFLNGALTLSILGVALALRGARVSGELPSGVGSRLLELWRGVALALVLQALYVVCLRFATG